jgi:hypothetical protein
VLLQVIHLIVLLNMCNSMRETDWLWLTRQDWGMLIEKIKPHMRKSLEKCKTMQMAWLLSGKLTTIDGMLLIVLLFITWMLCLQIGILGFAFTFWPIAIIIKQIKHRNKLETKFKMFGERQNYKVRYLKKTSWCGAVTGLQLIPVKFWHSLGMDLLHRSDKTQKRSCELRSKQ